MYHTPIEIHVYLESTKLLIYHLSVQNFTAFKTEKADLEVLIDVTSLTRKWLSFSHAGMTRELDQNVLHTLNYKNE